MNARRDLYTALMAGGPHSPDRSEKASNLIDAFLAEAAAEERARTADREPVEHGPLWSLLDWSFWGAGMGDVFREPLADTMLAAISPEQREQAEQIMADFIERRKIEKTGVTVWQEQRDELEQLQEERAQVVAEVARFGIYGSATAATKAIVGRASELVDENARLKARVPELETYAHGCDAEGCVLPHSSWCERAKKTAAENNGCTCGQPWTGHPQPHAMHCWTVNPPRSEVDTMRARITELEAQLAEMTRHRDNARGLVTDLKEQRERRRIRLVEAETDLLNMRGLLSPNGFPRRIPDEVEIHERVAPAVEWLLGRVTELETERAKYVGHEPTIAEEMAYLSNSLDAVLALCHETKRSGSLGVTPEAVEQAAAGEWTAATARPALPWAAVMDDHDLSMFLDDLASAALGRWQTDADGPIPDRNTLAVIEKACQDWRTPGQGLRGDEPEAKR